MKLPLTLVSGDGPVAASDESAAPNAVSAHLFIQSAASDAKGEGSLAHVAAMFFDGGDDRLALPRPKSG
jgi:hypothetical protein